MDREAFTRRLLAGFLRGEFEASPESWVFRENRLVWWYLSKPWALDREIAQTIQRAKEPWAWESLRRLYNRVREDDEPLPASLQTWADDVVNERCSRRNPRGPKPDVDRNARYRIALTVLTMLLGHTRENAIALMAEATGEPEDTVCSTLRRGS